MDDLELPVYMSYDTDEAVIFMEYCLVVIGYSFDDVETMLSFVNRDDSIDLLIGRTRERIEKDLMLLN
jgi:hypothetical protein